VRDAIDVLPRLPDTDSAEEIRAYLRGSLHYSSAQSRERVAAYVMRRLFPAGTPDRALRLFARHYADRQALRDAAFYRFCLAEPLTFALTDDLVLPAIAAGQLDRGRLRAYLAERFPSSRSLIKCVQAFADALGPAGIAHVDRGAIHVAYRDIALPSFAFVLHSEFPAPGMYPIAKLEGNRAVRALLWNPDQVLPALYELRNRGILSKVSEIDSVRQFTTRLTLERAVEVMAAMPAEGTHA
jgi:DNA repair protein RadC